MLYMKIVDLTETAREYYKKKLVSTSWQFTDVLFAGWLADR